MFAKYLRDERPIWVARIAELKYAILMPNSRTSSRGKKGFASIKTPLQLDVKLPSKRVRESFLIIYELKGGQKAVNFLTEYYKVRKMKMVLDGKKSRKQLFGFLGKNTAYFKKNGLKKRFVLHELYHHLVVSKGVELTIRTEEHEANSYAKECMR